MRFGTKKALILALTPTLSFVFFLVSDNAWASRKLNQAAHVNDIERALSANESLLNRFMNEREQMLNSSERLTSPHIFRNKLTIINNKITFLEQEIKRTKPRLQKSAAKSKAPAKSAKVEPVSVAFRSDAKPETRKGYFLAYSAKLAKFLRPQVQTERIPPQEGVLPVKVDPIVKRDVPVRQIAQTAILPEKITPISVSTLPAREAAQTIEQLPKEKIQEAPITIAPPEAEVRRYFPGSGQEPDQGTMAILKQPVSDKARTRTAKTGLDWKSMTAAEKEIYVLSVMGNLSRRDVFLMKSYNYYIKSVDRSITEDPSLETEFVHKILINNAYSSEPESRRDLEKVWR